MSKRFNCSDGIFIRSGQTSDQRCAEVKSQDCPLLASRLVVAGAVFGRQSVLEPEELRGVGDWHRYRIRSAVGADRERQIGPASFLVQKGVLLESKSGKSQRPEYFHSTSSRLRRQKGKLGGGKREVINGQPLPIACGIRHQPDQPQSRAGRPFPNWLVGDREADLVGERRAILGAFWPGREAQIQVGYPGGDIRRKRVGGGRVAIISEGYRLGLAVLPPQFPDRKSVV